MEDVRIVEDGVTNVRTAGTTRKSKRYIEITAKMQKITSETKIDKEVALIIKVPSENEIALLCTEIRKDVWITDFFASSHMTNTLAAGNVQPT